MALPYTGMDAVPFTPLTAEFLDQMIANIEALAAGTGLNTGAVTTTKILDSNVTTVKLADDAVTDAKLVNGKFRARQGGNSTIWGTYGTTNYDVSATNVIQQAGALRISGATGTQVTLTFPVAFSTAPVVVVSAASADGNNVTFSTNTTTATTVQVRLLFSGGGTATETVNWIAVGQ